jgi:hypothetical protein
MIVGDKQDISRVTNSTINQAGRDLTVYSGLSASDVIAIVKETVASELTIYSQNAERQAAERLNQFSNDLVVQLADKVSDRLNRFNEPSLQFAVRDAALSYVKSGKDLDEKALIDLMIERVKVDEHTTKQKLIDQAIRIVPNLSAECLALLSIFVFRLLILKGERAALEKWIDSVSPILDTLQNVSSLDIEYLIQVDCVSAMSGIMTQESWMENCPKQNDLFFRHPIPIEMAKQFKAKYGITSVSGGFTMVNPSLFGVVDNVVVFFSRLMQFEQDGSIRFNLTNTSLVDELINNYNLPSIREDVYALINASLPFSPDDVKNFFVSRNPGWAKAIEIIDGQRLRSFNLLPVGAYIGARQLSMLSGRDLALETFYK